MNTATHAHYRHYDARCDCTEDAIIGQ